MHGNYRKLGSSGITVLDVSANKGPGIGTFILKTANSLERAYPLYTGDGFSLQTGDCIRRCGFVSDYEDLHKLMAWLVENSESFVDQLNDADKALLLQHLTALSRRWSLRDRKKLMKESVPRLSLFRAAAPTQTNERLVPQTKHVGDMEMIPSQFRLPPLALVVSTS